VHQRDTDLGQPLDLADDAVPVPGSPTRAVRMKNAGSVSTMRPNTAA